MTCIERHQILKLLSNNHKSKIISRGTERNSKIDTRSQNDSSLKKSITILKTDESNENLFNTKEKLRRNSKEVK